MCHEIGVDTTVHVSITVGDSASSRLGFGSPHWSLGKTPNVTAAYLCIMIRLHVTLNKTDLSNVVSVM